MLSTNINPYITFDSKMCRYIYIYFSNLAILIVGHVSAYIV